MARYRPHWHGDIPASGHDFCPGCDLGHGDTLDEGVELEPGDVIVLTGSELPALVARIRSQIVVGDPVTAEAIDRVITSELIR